MSVAAHSPFRGSKRSHHFEQEDQQEGENPHPFSAGKRSRFHAPSPAGGRCTPLSERQAYVVSASTVVALRGLFPEMDEQTISTVLCECGDNIDSAIRRLNELKLGGAGTAELEQQQQQQTVDAAVAGSSGTATPPQGQQQAQQQQLDLTPWVEAVLQQMAEAKDVDEARQRAGSVLTSMATTLVESLGASRKEENAGLRAQAHELAKDNGILKRAVAIQNGRLQELASRESEAAALRQLLEQYQQKVHALELSNYSLALHLKQAAPGTDAPAAHSQRHPDVF